MLNPITLTAIQNRFMQDIFTEIYQDDRVRSLEGDLILSILNKVKAWPAPLVLTNQEDRRIQYQLEQFYEVIGQGVQPYVPSTVPLIPPEVVLIQAILKIMEAAR